MWRIIHEEVRMHGEEAALFLPVLWRLVSPCEPVWNTFSDLCQANHHTNKTRYNITCNTHKHTSVKC